MTDSIPNYQSDQDSVQDLVDPHGPVVVLSMNTMEEDVQPKKKAKIDAIASSTVSSKECNDFSTIVDHILRKFSLATEIFVDENTIKQVLLLKYKIVQKASDLHLWTLYLRSGTGHLSENHDDRESSHCFWPAQEIQEDMREHGLMSEDFLFYVQHKIAQLQHEKLQLETLLRNFTATMQRDHVEKLDEIVEYGYRKAQLKYNGQSNDEQMARLKYIYTNQILKSKFSNLSTSSYQVKLLAFFQQSLTRHFSWTCTQN